MKVRKSKRRFVPQVFSLDSRFLLSQIADPITGQMFDPAIQIAPTTLQEFHDLGYDPKDTSQWLVSPIHPSMTGLNLGPNHMIPPGGVWILGSDPTNSMGFGAFKNMMPQQYYVIYPLADGTTAKPADWDSTPFYSETIQGLYGPTTFNYYKGGIFSPGVQGIPSVQAQIIFDGQPAPADLNTPMTDVIGDKFTVSAIAASGKTISTIDWSIQNITNGVADIIQSQTMTQLHGFENTPFGVNGEVDGVLPTPLTAYWGPYGGIETVQATLHYQDGSSDIVSQNVQVDVPNSSLTPTHFGTATLVSGLGGAALKGGAGINDLGLEWQMKVDTTDGILFNFGTVQTIDQAAVETVYNTILGHVYLREYFRDPTTGSQVIPLLDNDPNGGYSLFYDSKVGTSGTPETTSDTPSLGFEPASWIHPFGVLFAGVDERFTDTLMVQPTTGQVGPGIYVPVGSESWAWSAYWDVLTPNQLASSSSPHIVSAYGGTTTYPTWNSLGSAYTDSANPIYYEQQLI